MLSGLNTKLSGHRTIIAAWLGVLVLALGAALELDLAALGVEGPVTWAAVGQAFWAAVVVSFLRRGVADAKAGAAGALLVCVLLLPGCVAAETQAAAWALSKDMPIFVGASVPAPAWLAEAQAEGMSEAEARAVWLELGALLRANSARVAADLGGQP